MDKKISIFLCSFFSVSRPTCIGQLWYILIAGTTWLQEIVYLIHSDLDISGAQNRLLDDRFPYLEFMYPGTKVVATNPSPRLIKSHLPVKLLPSGINEKKPKVHFTHGFR